MVVFYVNFLLQWKLHKQTVETQSLFLRLSKENIIVILLKVSFELSNKHERGEK